MKKARPKRSRRSGPKQPKREIIDLFSGAGGLSLGAARAGLSVLAAVETDLQAITTHARNFPSSLHINEDVSSLTGRWLTEKVQRRMGEIDGIVGGPPCQGFSVIGERDESDSRNTLFEHFFRIVSEVRPRFFLAENVPGILRGDHAELLQRSFDRVSDYVLLDPISIDAQDFGVPQRRRRVFFVGYREEEMDAVSHHDLNPADNMDRTTVGQALSGLHPAVSQHWQTERQSWRIARAPALSNYYGERVQGFVPEGVGDEEAIRRLAEESRASGAFGTVHSPKVAQRYASIKAGTRDSVSKSHKLETNGVCPTIRAGTGFDRGRFQAVRPIHPTINRVITPREAARLQGFPDWFRFAPTKWHSFRQIGNSVSPIVAERLLAVVAGTT